MKIFLKSSLPYNQTLSNLLQRVFGILAFAVLAGSIPVSAQEIPEFKCQEKVPTFVGVPERTLCEKNPNFECRVEIGSGTSYPNASSLLSSSISGNVCIVGNFNVDVPFSFQNAIVKINPGVTIAIAPSPNGYDVGSSLTIDNSKLFACVKLWKGITMGHLSSISTLNNCVIEDAETAIYASGFCALSIQTTTFNRNRVGIELNTPFPNIWILGPVIWLFKGNDFICDAPLNGTTNEITQVGVKLKDSDLFPLFGNTDNTFQGIITGILAEGNASNIYADDYDFISIRDRGINFKGRSLEVLNSTFTGIVANGIYFHESSQLLLTNNEFYLGPITDLMYSRYAVEVDMPNPDNDLHIVDNYFNISGALPDWNISAIRFNTQTLSTFRAVIELNIFDLLNPSLLISGVPPYPVGTNSHGVAMFGNHTSDSDIDIETNHFNVDIALPSNNEGVLAQGGSKHNIHVNGNHFTGGGAHVHYWGSPNGGQNEITSNTIDPSNFAGNGVWIRDFPRTTICSNTNNAASFTAYIFIGQNPSTVFTNNTTYGTWNRAVSIASGSIIGQQTRTGNKWYPATIYTDYGPVGPGYYYIQPVLQNYNSSPTSILMSKFFVQTPQSIWTNSQYTFFSEFHPATHQIIPDANDEFVDEESGPLNINCAAQLSAPDWVDLSVANGSFAMNIQNQGAIFDTKRFLYKKLQENVAYQSVHPAFATFLSTEQSTSVGKFYQLEKTIDDAHRLSANNKTTLDNLKIQRSTLNQFLGQQGITQSQSLGYITQKKSLDGTAYAILSQHDANKVTALSSALSLWQTINPQNVFEQYRKDVLGIYLTSQTQQGGQLTTVQVQALQNIAKLCSEEGGSAVYLAQGFLPACDLTAIASFIEQCGAMPEVENREELQSNQILISEEAKAQLSPNPAQDWINITSVRQMAGQVEIYSLTGQLMATRVITFGENPLQLDLNSGVYLVRVVYANGDKSSHKLVINK